MKKLIPLSGDKRCEGALRGWRGHSKKVSLRERLTLKRFRSNPRQRHTPTSKAIRCDKWTDVKFHLRGLGGHVVYMKG